MLQLPPVDRAQFNTIMAALRYYQKRGQGDPFMRTHDIHEIATDGDDISLDEKGIDELAMMLNTESISAPEPQTTSSPSGGDCSSGETAG